MIGLLALLITAQAPAGPSPNPSRPIDSWTCTTQEQLDSHVSGMMQLLVFPDGDRREIAFDINWGRQPGHVAEQQASWVGIPADATQLWKPDKIGFMVDTKRTDEKGIVTFHSRANGPISHPPTVRVKSLRPTFSGSWVTIEDAYLVAKLWANWPWDATLTDRRGKKLGTQSILLPDRATAQAMFTRLSAELNRRAANKETQCAPNFGPDEDELMQQVI